MRITGGVLRSRAISAPRGQETRPTSDRVREALFSMLVSDGVFAGGGEGGAEAEEEGPRVLDLYAGSGALAFEALSRGAISATLVESGRPAIAAIRENIAALDLESRVTLLTKPCERALEGLIPDEDPTKHPRFELILIDPPYADVKTPGFGRVLLRASRLLVSGGILVLEHEAKDEPAAPEGLEVDRRRRHGDTVLSLFRRP